MEVTLLKNREEVFERDEAILNEYLAEFEDSGEAFTHENVNPRVWMNTYWDRMDPDRREDLLVEMMRDTLRRAQSQPLYQQSDEFMAMDPDDLESMEDLLEWPVLTKDGQEGFRDDVAADPDLMRPTEQVSDTTRVYDAIHEDGRPYVVEKPGVNREFSGGTGGAPTNTDLSEIDFDIDAYGNTRALMYGGLEEGDTVLNGYNLTHKGGKAIDKSTRIMDGTVISMRPEDSAADVVENIKRNDIDMIAAVETGETGDNKDGGKNFFGLQYEDYQAVTDIDKWFVTGYPLIDSLIDLSEDSIQEHEDHGERRKLFTTYGTSEAIPLATSTALYDDDSGASYNSQHVLPGPHYVQVAVEEDGELRPAEEGERGIALVTTVDRRDGTIYVNYALGDAATVETYEDDASYFTTPRIKDIEKIDDPLEVLEGGCTVI